MKVKCINKTHYVHITVDRIYECEDSLTEVYAIKNNIGTICHYPVSLFERILDEDEPRMFGELSEYAQMSLFQSWLRGELIQALDVHKHWYVNSYPNWGRGVCYRVKPVELTKPSIDWSHVCSKFNWLTSDENEVAFLHATEPTFNEHGAWRTTVDGAIQRAWVFTSYRKGTCNWKDSLVERPNA